MVGGLADYFLGIGHCYTEAGILDHAEVIESVTAGDEFMTAESQTLQQVIQTLGFVNA